MARERIEQKIKDFVRAQGVSIVGIAGPDRLDGPPSLDPTYTLTGARSIISLAAPMDVQAIYDFLGKKSPAPHNLDQTRMNQWLHRVSARTAEFIAGWGYRAAPVPSNNTYRRSLDAFATHPSFSHRFGAIAAGIGAHGLSGNVMTKEHGAAVYLGTVVTDAVLASDPPLPPRYFMDGLCSSCRLCEKTCVAGMFDPQEEETVLLNGELHPRGKRRNIDFCNASCFGLHSLSRDKKWTTWGFRWIREWVDALPDPRRTVTIRRVLMNEGARAGDSTARYNLIRTIGSILHPENTITDYLDSHPEKHAEPERFAMLRDWAEKLGVTGLKNELVLTCGHCAMVCGPTVEESARRYRALANGGLVVPGPGGRMTVVPTYDAAVAMRKTYLPRVPARDKRRDSLASAWLWHKFYFGIEPRSIIQGILYARRLRRARAASHTDRRD